MRRFLMFGAIMIMQGVAIIPVRALAQSDADRFSDTSSDDAPSAVTQGGRYPYPSGRYGYPPQASQPYPAQSYPQQPYPAQPYPAQPYPAQSYPAQSAPSLSFPSRPYSAQPVPPQATSPNAACPPGRFYDHMTKTCESP